MRRNSDIQTRSMPLWRDNWIRRGDQGKISYVGGPLCSAMPSTGLIIFLSSLRQPVPFLYWLAMTRCVYGRVYSLLRVSVCPRLDLFALLQPLFASKLTRTGSMVPECNERRNERSNLGTRVRAESLAGHVPYCSTPQRWPPLPGWTEIRLELKSMRPAWRRLHWPIRRGLST